ncbi:MAG: 16S rRNA (uracil(1498)-N(3))-methyltransferase [Bacteroidota bacterium]|nr:16S rRNA (uracil(1498)-N(3))-methyltransferase [Bacteroidota bacterium]
MDIPIFFLHAFSPANIITLDEETSKHAVQVLRMKAGQNLQLADGAGNLLTAEILDEHKKKCTVKIIDTKVVARKQQVVSVGISLLKNVSRFEWFLEKATEIGVTEIVPLLCERTEKQHFRFERMKQIVISAMMQSKQVWLPTLQQPMPMRKAVGVSNHGLKLIAHCEEETKSSITDFRKQLSVNILIGPEGDFTKDEISLAIDHYYAPVSLGETRLRAETAGVVASTILCIR